MTRFVLHALGVWLFCLALTSAAHGATAAKLLARYQPVTYVDARRTGALRARSVGYGEHCTGTGRAWSRTPRWGRTHPIVYVAAGSHAGYFRSGSHPIAVKCLPQQAVTLLQQNGLALPVDRSGAGAVAGPPALGAQVTSVVRMARQRWLRFPGTWGEEQYLHGPAPLGTTAFGTAPVGPRFQKSWRRPFATLASWPAG